MNDTRAIAEAILKGQARLVSRVTEEERSVACFEPGDVTLAPRELQVLAAAEGGAANKVVAIDYALSCSTVSETLVHAFKKLGFSSRAQFLQVMTTLRSATDARVMHASGRVWVETPTRAPGLYERLTSAERAVVAGVVNGETNREIGERRGSSTRTVANQLAAIYRKVGVSSRWELVVSCARCVATGA